MLSLGPEEFQHVMLEDLPQALHDTYSPDHAETEQGSQSVETVDVQEPTTQHADISSYTESTENRVPKLNQLVHGIFFLFVISSWQKNHSCGSYICEYM